MAKDNGKIKEKAAFSKAVWMCKDGHCAWIHPSDVAQRKTEGHKPAQKKVAEVK